VIRATFPLHISERKLLCIESFHFARLNRHANPKKLRLTPGHSSQPIRWAKAHYSIGPQSRYDPKAF
jgi:hypothetical protein